MPIRNLRRGPAIVALALLAAVGPARAFNILPNPSFEYWVLGMPVGWLSSEPLLPGSAVRDSSARTGNWCIRLNARDTSAFVTTTTIVRPGYAYAFSGWARVPGLVGGSFLLQFLTLTLEPVGTPVLLPAVYSSGYREYARWLTAPENSALLSVGFATLPGTTVWLDDLTLADTTLSGVEEPLPPVSRPGLLPRRMLATPAAIAGLGPDAVIYDAAGRRLSGPGQMRPYRVYFIVVHPGGKQ